MLYSHFLKEYMEKIKHARYIKQKNVDSLHKFLKFEKTQFKNAIFNISQKKILKLVR